MNSTPGDAMRRGFTLIELLAVVAILATLTGLMLPVLAGGREAARATACVSNIRQLQLANLMHSQDHRGRFVAGAPGIAGANLQRWHGVRERVSAPFEPAHAPITDYLDAAPLSRSLRECPTFTPTLDMLGGAGGGFERGNGGYGYNNAFVGVSRRLNRFGQWEIESDALGSNMNRFAQPARTVAFTDAAFTGVSGVIEYSFAEPRFWPEFPSYRPDPSTHFRHAGTAGFAWLDGHVTSEAMTFTWGGFSSKIDPKSVGLGWSGARDSNSLYDYD